MITADDCYRVLSIPFLDRKRCGRITASVLSAIHTGQLAAHETTDHDHTWFHDPCLAASFETVIDFIRARRLFGDYACDLA